MQLNILLLGYLVIKIWYNKILITAERLGEKYELNYLPILWTKGKIKKKIVDIWDNKVISKTLEWIWELPKTPPIINLYICPRIPSEQTQVGSSFVSFH